ncbi:MAG: hypothetical protein IKN64_07835 [Desulfovibrio sp.]|nr:hypothetical protein [Desulfovibrio sp.]
MLIEPADINAYVSATDYIKKEGGRCITNIFLAYDELEKLVVSSVNNHINLSFF